MKEENCDGRIMNNAEGEREGKEEEMQGGRTQEIVRRRRRGMGARGIARRKPNKLQIVFIYN